MLMKNMKKVNHPLSQMTKNKDFKNKIILFVSLIIISILFYVVSQQFNLPLVKEYVAKQGILGMFIYILLQVFQIVVALVPGEPIQIFGGFLYGNLLGFILSTIGIMFGSVIAFYLARKLGLPLVKIFVKEELLIKVQNKLETNSASAILFLLFLFPGLPKDVLVYALGLSNIRFNRFFIIYFVARIPGMFVANYIGAQALHITTAQVLGLSVLLIPILALIYWQRKPLQALLSL